MPDGKTIEVPPSIGYEIQEQLFNPNRLLIAGAGAIMAASVAAAADQTASGNGAGTDAVPNARETDHTVEAAGGAAGGVVAPTLPATTATTSTAAATANSGATASTADSKLSAISSTPVKVSPAKRAKLTPVAKNEAALLGLGNIVCACIAKCEVDLKKELYGNVIVTGGNTLFPGFVDRLHNEIYYELDRMQPNLGSKLRIIAPQTPKEQHFR